MLPGASVMRDETSLLPDDEVHIWETHLDSIPRELWRLILSSDEVRVLHRLRTELVRDRFVGRRIFRRAVLAFYTSLAPQNLVFATNAWGKPVLASGNAGAKLEFSTASSRDVALLAVTGNMPAGVDLEYIDAGFDFLPLLEGQCSEADLQRLSRLPADVQRTAFFQRWTELESYGKAVGQGLSVAWPLQFPDWRPAGGPVERTAVVQGHDGIDWWLRSLNLHSEGYCAALCCRVPPRRIKYFCLQAVADPRTATEESRFLLRFTPDVQFRVSFRAVSDIGRPPSNIR